LILENLNGLNLIMGNGMRLSRLGYVCALGLRAAPFSFVALLFPLLTCFLWLRLQRGVAVGGERSELGFTGRSPVTTMRRYDAGDKV